MQRVVLPSDDRELSALAGLSHAVDGSDGLFAVDSWLRRVSAERSLLFGGGRALLLEVAHPLVAAGVAEHSNFRTNPFGRLQRTLDAMSTLTFGARTEAFAAARSVEQAHQRVHGRLKQRVGRFEAGSAYHGRDPELVRWVWATLVDTSVVVYELFVGPLAPADREAYYRDHAVMARLLGVPGEGVPEDWKSFRVYFDGVLTDGSLCVGDQARAIAEAVLHPPGVPNAGLVRSLTAALLPSGLREAFALAWGEEQAQRFDALVASVRRLRAERPSTVPDTPLGGRRRGDLR